MKDECVDQSQTEFLEWMRQQPKDRPIEHDGGWEICACGQYGDEVVNEGGVYVAYELIGAELRTILGNPSTHPLGKTYGETVAYLEKEGFYSYLT